MDARVHMGAPKALMEATLKSGKSSRARSELMTLLRRHPSFVNYPYMGKRTLLLVACSVRAPADIVEFLLLQGANPNAQAQNGRAALHFARGSEIVDLLVRHGARVDIKDLKGATPLMHASLDNNAETVVALLRHGANPNEIDSRGATPLLYAARGIAYNKTLFRRYDTAKALLKAGATAKGVDLTGISEAMLRSIPKGMLKILIERGAMHYEGPKYGPVMIKNIVERTVNASVPFGVPDLDERLFWALRKVRHGTSAACNIGTILLTLAKSSMRARVYSSYINRISDKPRREPMLHQYDDYERDRRLRSGAKREPEAGENVASQIRACFPKKERIPNVTAYRSLFAERLTRVLTSLERRALVPNSHKKKNMLLDLSKWTSGPYQRVQNARENRRAEERSLDALSLNASIGTFMRRHAPRTPERPAGAAWKNARDSTYLYRGMHGPQAKTLKSKKILNIRGYVPFSTSQKTAASFARSGIVVRVPIQSLPPGVPWIWFRDPNSNDSKVNRSTRRTHPKSEADENEVLFPPGQIRIVKKVDDVTYEGRYEPDVEAKTVFASKNIVKFKK